MMGHCWVVGVGPGDPGLLTVKAVALLRCAHVLYHPGPAPAQGRAWAVVRDLVRPEQQVRLVLAESMPQAAARDDRSAYLPTADRIASDCRAGLDVAVITEGDPTLYSTASHVWELLTELYPDVRVEVVPGISSITAAAARVGWPLAQHGEAVAIVPASYRREELRPLLERFATVCFLKVAQVLPDLRAVLNSQPSAWEAVYAENVSTPAERITHDLSAVEGGPYFALVLVRCAADSASGGRQPPVPRTASRPGSQQGADAPRSPGQLAVVGLGPGDVRLLTAQALEALHTAEVIVGYDAYLDALRPLGLAGELRGSPIGAEAERARLALELAAAGRRVALVSSGDAGVYGMASLVLETTETTPGVEVEILPGVTAALAAAALLGAPLGHDFACISLSDLLTPWPLIERRLEAAGQGDLVIALYNPLSQRRTWQLPRARDILLMHRRPETTVGLVDRAYRTGARVWTTTLAELSGEGVGMETVVIVGTSTTRMVGGRMVTPRGYGAAGTGRSAKPQAARGQTESGRRILAESFALIERELGPHDLLPWVFAVVRRLIHASADFDFAHTLRHSPDFEAAFRAALRDGAPVVTDTEMVRLGVLAALGERPGQVLACYLNDPEALALAESAGLTRSAAGMRVAARRHPAPLLAIGNAPTALDEALRLAEEEGWRPAALVGIPVGFVGVEQAKHRLQAQARVPYLTCVGRKGGSAVTAAAINALVEVLGLS